MIPPPPYDLTTIVLNPITFISTKTYNPVYPLLNYFNMD